MYKLEAKIAFNVLPSRVRLEYIYFWFLVVSAGRERN